MPALPSSSCVRNFAPVSFATGYGGGGGEKGYAVTVRCPTQSPYHCRGDNHPKDNDNVLSSAFLAHQIRQILNNKSLLPLFFRA